MQNTASNNGIEEIFTESRDREKIENLFSKVDVKNINYYKISNSLEILISSQKLISAQLLAEVEEIFACYFKLDSVHIKVKFNIDRPLDYLIKEYWESILFNAGKKIATSRGLLSGSEFSLKNNNKNIIVHLKTKGAYLLKAQECDKYMQEIIEEAFSAKIKVDFEDGNIDEYLHNEYLENKKNEEARILKNITILTPESKDKRNAKRKASEEKQENVIIGKDFKDELKEICSINQDSGITAFKGDIMMVECRSIRENRYLYTFDITDYTSSLTVKFFAAKKNAVRINAKIKEGITVKVKGETRFDKFAGEFVIIASDIVQVEKQRRVDTAEEKRVELHLHTQMSAMDGVTPVEELIKRASEWGHKAIAITDHGVVQAYPRASIAASKYNIKVIYGVECYLINDSCQNEGNNAGKQKADSYHAIILVKNVKGMKNLYKLVSLSHIKFFYKKPRIPKKILAQYRDGLLIGTACEAGELYRAFLENKSEEEILEIASFYDYFEIQPLGNNQFMLSEGIVSSIEDLKILNKKIVQLGEKMGKLVVATCDVHFLDPADEVFRRILMAGQGYDDADRQAPLFFRTTDEMMEEFMYLGKEKAYELVVLNTNKISGSIEDISPIPRGTFPPKLEGAEEKIIKLAMEQAKEKYGTPLPQIVEDRMKRELDSIVKNGFSVMYLIASILVQKSVSSGYLVGSRGSVGSSIVAYFTRITEVNPLKPHYICDNCKYSEFITDNSYGCGYDLPDKICPVCGETLEKDGYDIPFETFLGFEGDKEPDIDLNFSGEYQARAHKLVEDLFGEDHVYRAGTISSIAEKTAYGFVKGYLDEKGMVVTNAEMNRLIRGCTGVKRTTGQHPGGVIIVPQDMEIYDFTPIQYPADDTGSHTITTHFDYDFLHGSIFKLDILGHDDPTTLKMLGDLTGIDPRSISIGDPLTISIFNSTDALGVTPDDTNCEVGTLAIPELGTKFVRQMLAETRPKTVSELIRISGLSHGTNVWINNAQDLIKSGTAAFSEVISTRDDIMLYLIHLGLPPIKAFKIMEDVRKGKGLTGEYEDIMREHIVPEWYIDSCKKIKYLYPKAHAAAYVMMAFRIAWFKVYYPLEFYSVYFTIKVNEFDARIMTQDRAVIKNHIQEIENKGNSITQKEKGMLTLLEVVNEMYARNIKFLPVDLYKSDVKTFIIEDGSIRPPLASLQGLGITAAQSIVNARREGTFTSVEDLKVRSKASKTVIDILKEHGCLKNLPESSQISLF